MNLLAHVFAGCTAGILLFFTREIDLIDYFLFISLSIFMDLDHVVNLLLKRSKMHLRSFIQEPFAIGMIGIPLGIGLSWIFNDFIYFWLTILLYSLHVVLDYSCIFEAYPLDPFSKRIIKPEGYGFIFPITYHFGRKKAEFPKTIDEIYVLLILAGILGIVLLVYY
jgi:hypothetical protein